MKKQCLNCDNFDRDIYCYKHDKYVEENELCDDFKGVVEVVDLKWLNNRCEKGATRYIIDEYKNVYILMFQSYGYSTDLARFDTFEQAKEAATTHFNNFVLGLIK